MRIWMWALLPLLCSCDLEETKADTGSSEADTDTDTDTDTDADADTDTDTDTDTTPETETDCTDGLDEDADGLTDCEDEDCAAVCVEDCGDKLDNDQDGLIDCDDVDDCTCTETDCADGLDEDGDGLMDCEDDDCIDVCVEDCANAADDDQDGLTDCDDDECYGVGTCGGPYNLTSVVDFDTIAWGGGPYWTSIGSYSYNIAVYAPVGSVQVRGTPDGWKGAPISCNGDIVGGFDLGGLYLPDMFTYIGPYTGVDYALGFQPSVSAGTLSWSGSCPVSALPYVTLGFVGGSDYIYRGNYGKWYPQYYAKNSEHEGLSGYYTIDFLYYTTQATPIEWDATY